MRVMTTAMVPEGSHLLPILSASAKRTYVVQAPSWYFAPSGYGGCKSIDRAMDFGSTCPWTLFKGVWFPVCACVSTDWAQQL